MKSRTFAHIFVLAVLAGIPAAAQTTILQGTVTDIQGGLIPTAIVTVTNQDTSAARQTVSDNSGAYVFQQMQPGPYKIQVQRAVCPRTRRRPTSPTRALSAAPISC